MTLSRYALNLTVSPAVYRRERHQPWEGSVLSILTSFTRGKLAVIPGAIAASALIFAGCSGDDDGGSSGGSDEDYVEALCGGFKDLFEELAQIPPASGGSEEATERAVDAIRSFADTLEDANPPSDVAEANDTMVTNFREAADKLADGDASGFQELGTDFELPEDVEARITAAVEKDETCQESGLGDFFGTE